MNKKTLNEECLQDVSGGTFKDLHEIRAFIKEHDPKYEKTPLESILVSEWLYRHYGMENMIIRPHGRNSFILAGRGTLTQEQLMELLRNDY